jgi:hypothetical protein
MILNLVLWVGGVALILLAVFRAQQPWRRLAELDHLAENARRYDGWRGGRRTSDAPETTGADVMREILRRRLLIWGAVAAVGGLLVLAGFVIR